MPDVSRCLVLAGANAGEIGIAMIFSAVLTGVEIIILTRLISPSAGVRAFAMFIAALGAVGGTIFGLWASGGGDQWDVLSKVMPCMLIGAALGIGIVAMCKLSTRSQPQDPDAVDQDR